MATSTVFQDLTPEQLAKNRAEKVSLTSSVINDIDSEYQLTNPDIIDNVVWNRTSNGHILVTKSSVEGAHDPDKENVEETGEPPAGDAAIFAIVCKIVREGTFLHTDGGYPSKYTAKLTDAKLTLAVGPASEGSWPEEYKKSLLVLEEILAQVSDKRRDRVGFKAQHGDILKFKHSIFEVPDERTPDEDYNATSDWPVRSETAIEALNKIVDSRSHVAYPMLAYDLNGETIDPIAYGSKLIDATVVLRFTLQHYVITNTGAAGTKTTSDTFTAAVQHIRVIANPARKGPVTPRKKRPGKMDPVYGELSPSKRRRNSEAEDEQGRGTTGMNLRKKLKGAATPAGPSSSTRKGSKWLAFTILSFMQH